MGESETGIYWFEADITRGSRCSYVEGHAQAGHGVAGGENEFTKFGFRHPGKTAPWISLLADVARLAESSNAKKLQHGAGQLYPVRATCLGHGHRTGRDHALSGFSAFHATMPRAGATMLVRADLQPPPSATS
jgi:hypothetical protein